MDKKKKTTHDAAAKHHVAAKVTTVTEGAKFKTEPAHEEVAALPAEELAHEAPVAAHKVVTEETHAEVAEEAHKEDEHKEEVSEANGVEAVVESPLAEESLVEPDVAEVPEADEDNEITRHLAVMEKVARYNAIFKSGTPYHIKHRGRVVYNTYTSTLKPVAYYDHIGIFGLNYPYAGLEVVTA